MSSILSLFLLLSFVLAVYSADWDGTFKDPLFGNDLKVCVSTYNGKTYGQAIMSTMGYLRGEIDTNNNWVGNYYLPGADLTWGSFDLTLAADTNSFTGTYTDYLTKFTKTVTDTTTSQRNGNTKPNDIECFNTDISLLDDFSVTDFDGAWSEDAEFTAFFDSNPSFMTTSYKYVSNGKNINGTSYDRPFPNVKNLVGGTWYETGLDGGVNIYALKDDNTVYELWLGTQSIYEIDPATWFTENPESWGFSIKTRDNTYSYDVVEQKAYENECTALWSESAEQDCYKSEYVIKAANDDDVTNADVQSVAGAAVAFSLLTFLLVIGLFFYVYKNKPAESHNSSSSSV